MDKNDILYEKFKDFALSNGYVNAEIFRKKFRISRIRSSCFIDRLFVDGFVSYYHIFGWYFTVVKKKYKIKKDKSKIIVNIFNPLISIFDFMIQARSDFEMIIDRYYTRHSLIYKRAIFIFVNEGSVYIYDLKMGLRIRYKYAKRLMDLMEEDGIISPYNPKTNKQELLISKEDFFDKILNNIF